MSFLEFRNKFINDAINQNNSLNKQELKNSLNKLPLIIKNREGDQLIFIRDLHCDEAVGVNYTSENVSCKYDFNENSLIIASISPSWSHGWEDISHDKNISDLIYDYMSLLDQYIYRSYIINIIGALSITYGISGSYIGQTVFRYGYSEVIEDYDKFMDGIEIKDKCLNTNQKIFSYIMSRINALDPYINRSIFYFSKSLRLLCNLCEEEAIISLDNCVDTIIQSIKKREKLPTIKRKDMHRFLKDTINLNDRNVRSLDYIYDLRCNFGAHPAKSLWWDFNEVHMDYYEDLIYNVRYILIKFIEYECKERIIINNPISWYDWFMNYCDIIYDYIL